MSKIKIITIVCWAVTAVILAGLAVALLTGNLFGIRTGFKIGAPTFNIGGFGNMTGTFNKVGSYSVPADGVDSVDIDWADGSISVVPGDGSAILFDEYARRELKDSEKLTYTVSGGTLKIGYTGPRVTISVPTKQLEVQLPAQLAQNLGRLKINSASADLTAKGLNARTLTVQQTSGRTILSDIGAGSASVNTVSGETALTDFNATSLTAGSVSGAITLSGVTADTLGANTTSGSLRIGGTFKDIRAETVSGTIELSDTVDPGTIKCTSTSGTITASLPGSTNPTVSYSTVSGRFRSDIPVRTAGGNAPYRFSTVSGDIYLKTF